MFAKYGHKTSTKKREKWSFNVFNRIFEEMCEYASVHFRFYLKYFEYFQLKDSQDRVCICSFPKKRWT